MIRWIAPLLLLVSTVASAHEDTPGYNLWRARVQAKTCSLQVDIAMASIKKHLSGIEASDEICFDIGQLATYLFELDLAVDEAYDDLMKEDWETRYYFRLPFQERGTLLGACGVAVDPTLLPGDFKELLRRLEEFQPKLERLAP